MLARWLPPLLGGSLAVVGLWIALGIQRLLAYRRTWAVRFARELRRWDGRVPADLAQTTRRPPHVDS